MRPRSSWRSSLAAAGLPSGFALVLTLALCSRALAADSSAAKPEPWSLFSPQELSLRFAYGIGDTASLEFFTLGPRVAYDLPDFIPPIAGNRLRIGIETTGSIIRGDDRDHDGEFAFSPLIFDYRYDSGGMFVPFIEGGEGIVITTLRNLRLGGPFEFSSQAGVGMHLFFADEDAVTFAFRMRHISNAGIKDENSGLNTYFFAIGLSTFPERLKTR